ncbi:MAG: hybrid sensor histidine kinase/response regulator [Pseudomonadota bacterium]
MDDLLSEFLTETAENLDVIDAELVKFEQDPNDKAILDNIFRLVHTIKGTCGFLGLPRLETVAHHGETLLGKFRDGALTVTPAAVTLILESLDHIKSLLAHLESEGVEPEGSDDELIAKLDRAAAGELESGDAPAAVSVESATEDEAGEASETSSDNEDASDASGYNATEEELQAAFDAAPGPEEDTPAASAPAAAPEVKSEAKPASEPAAAQPPAPGKSDQPSLKNQSIRVNVDVLEDLMTMVSELVLTRNQLLQMVRNTDDSEFKGPLQRLSNVTAELQDAVMKTRMQPIGNAWQKLPRIIRDISQDVDKKIDLVMEGQDTELDRQVLELIKDPLTHMIRNSADHGLETTPERIAKGKPELGRITLRAFHEGGHIIIEIADDGAGLNTEKIKEKALSNGVVSPSEVATLTENQIHKFIFAPGFSTAAKVTNISGRGVGMDVVRTNIELIGGTIDLVSQENKGTTFTIKIPLTLAIVSALIVEANTDKFAIPQLAVIELVRTGTGSDYTIETINSTKVLRLRNRLLPLMDLNALLGSASERDLETGSHFVVVMEVGGQRFGLVVDNVYDTEEIVVKPVANVLRDIAMFSGNTILGDGSVIMIIDPNGIAKEISNREDEAQTEEISEKAARASQNKTAMLVFKAGSDEPKAAPLSLITRLEEIDVANIETSNGAQLVQYRGSLMTVVHADAYGSLKTEGRQPVLVFTDDQRSMGLAVDEIVDIVDEKLNVEHISDQPGVIGSAVVKGRATQVVDVAYFLTQAYPDWFDRAPCEEIKAGRKSILLVDDNAFFRNMLSPMLEIAGYEVTATSSADEALGLREHGHAFDLIVSDIEMPGMDGFTFAEKVREGDSNWAATPLLALSGLQTPEHMARSHEAGFTDYVAKNDRDRLIAMIGQALETSTQAA